jgi:hypothetical protein
MSKYWPQTVKAGDMTLEVNPLDPGDMLDFFESFEPEQVSKPSWYRYALWICSVRSINGVPVAFPKSATEVKALARKLGHPAVLAVQRVIDGEPGEPAFDQVDLDVAKN